MTTSPQDPPQPVHLAITLRAREGKVAALEEALLRFVKRSLDDQGATGVHLFRPVSGTDNREFQLHRSFRSEDHKRDFYQSEMYQQYQRETADLIEGPATIRPLHGFEAFFRGGHQPPPPRWKMAVVTWLGVFPAVLLWSRLLSPRLTALHPVAVTAIVTMFVVITLAWVIMPWLTKLARPWLHAK
ncbi:antibiotic biosynthesis monooxygenase [Planctomicrobium piriforme]|uniref:ABM domain-containing protein n=1 Tax=Planctomicrobium piriforme TaxID=1576369 RepID=A0A1I3CGV1_9PLAN|nr:antibiotic biosynthesis monooxygenase [Planctomicrobium piriforme]SFH73685.1 hypothetical protein SAMN05421753_102276 [Planctomicrobium piriforme]